MAKMTKNVPAKKEERTPPAVYDYGIDSGAGFEDVTNKDLSIPFIAVLQNNSPAVENKEPEGAEAGMLMNTVTHDLYYGDEGVGFVACHTEHAYVEWIPRNKGGGLVALHDPSSEAVKKAIASNGGQEFGPLKIGENELIDTRYTYGLLLDRSDWTNMLGYACVSFSSTKIRPYRHWTTSMYTITPRCPIFAFRNLLTTVKQKNKKGSFFNIHIKPYVGDWRGCLIDPSDPRGAELLRSAKDFREMAMTGRAKANFESERKTAGEESGGDAPF